MGNFDQFELVCKGMGNDMILDTRGVPGVYVPFDAVQNKALIETGSEALHPAFVLDGRQLKRIEIGKYHSTVYDGRAHSLPFDTPTRSVNWEAAAALCAAKGAGYHMLTLAEWALVCLSAKAADFRPKGNNDYGKDAGEKSGAGIPCAWEEDGKTSLILEGTGSTTYFHNGSLSGVWGMNGNVAQWIAGYRLVDGEIQIIADNDAAGSAAQNAESTMWRAILPDGALVSPGTAGTLHWNWMDDKITLDTETDAGASDVYTTAFDKLAVNAEHVESVPDILKALALFPESGGKYDGAMRTVRLQGERVGAAGGCFRDGESAGAFSLDMRYAREDESGDVGLRLAYAEPR